MKLADCASCNLMFQILERNAEAELDRLSRNSKQMTEQLQTNHAMDLKALERRLKIDQVLLLFFCRCVVTFVQCSRYCFASAFYMKFAVILLLLVLWPPCIAYADIIFLSCFFLLLYRHPME